MLIKLSDISIRFPKANQPALAAVNLDIHKGEILGLLAPSGKGKSLLGNLIAGFISDEAIPSGKISYYFDNQSFEQDFSTQNSSLPNAIQRNIAMIFQNPQTALNPTIRCGTQIAEAYLQIPKAQRKQLVFRLLNRVKLDDQERIFNAYPHQLSGGQQQRILIAIALAKKAKLLIADEPTTALDPEVQLDILILLKQIQQDENLTILWATHDRKVINFMANRIFDLDNHLFITPTKENNVSTNSAVFNESEKVLSIQNISKTFQQKKHTVRALKDISFDLFEGEILGIIGQSGSGKSTIAKVLTGLETTDSGQIIFPKGEKKVQMIFQNPATSLEPTMLVLESVKEVIRYNQPKQNRQELAIQLLNSLDIEESLFHRFPSELSGGQQQRIAIAKALATQPDILVLDEPTASLDAPTAAKVNTLIKSIAQDQSIGIIYISHTFQNILELTHNTIILKDGVIIEKGLTPTLFSAPQHPYTKQLLATAFGQWQKK